MTSTGFKRFGRAGSSSPRTLLTLAHAPESLGARVRCRNDRRLITSVSQFRASDFDGRMGRSFHRCFARPRAHITTLPVVGPAGIRAIRGAGAGQRRTGVRQGGRVDFLLFLSRCCCTFASPRPCVLVYRAGYCIRVRGGRDLVRFFRRANQVVVAAAAAAASLLTAMAATATLSSPPHHCERARSGGRDRCPAPARHGRSTDQSGQLFPIIYNT